MWCCLYAFPKVQAVYRCSASWLHHLGKRVAVQARLTLCVHCLAHGVSFSQCWTSKKRGRVAGGFWLWSALWTLADLQAVRSPLLWGPAVRLQWLATPSLSHGLATPSLFSTACVRGSTLQAAALLMPCSQRVPSWLACLLLTDMICAGRFIPGCCRLCKSSRSLASCSSPKRHCLPNGVALQYEEARLKSKQDSSWPLAYAGGGRLT